MPITSRIEKLLARAVASARDRAVARLHRTLAEAAIDEQRHRVEQLLEVAAGELLSPLELLRIHALPVREAG